MFTQSYENLSNGINMLQVSIFYVNKNIILINNCKNIKFFNQNFIYIAFKAC